MRDSVHIFYLQNDLHLKYFFNLLTTIMSTIKKILCMYIMNFVIS